MRMTLFLLVFAGAMGCDHTGDHLTREPGSQNSIHGSWILYEEGYSPGNGYIIKPVSENPPRTIFFSHEKQFTSTLQSLVDYKFYTIIKNTSSEKMELWLYKTEPDPLNEPDPSRKMYIFEFEDGNLKLYPAFPSMCIEGCHMGFKR